MEPLDALREILLGAIPTFLLVWVLFLYVTRVFFRPLQETLSKRHHATDGMREAAESSIAEAEKKTALYEERLQSARTELYQQQEQERQKAIERRAQVVERARAQAEETVGRARQEIGRDVEEAKKRLVAETEPMAQSISRAILEPAASGGKGLAR
jgi:F-type H+-transporting ATPase subunit b